MSVVQFLARNPFDSDTTKAMELAFDEACKDMREQSAIVREIIAKRIIEAAKKGERDPERLCAKALDALGILRRHS